MPLSEVADILMGYPFESEQYNNNGLGIRLARGMNIGSGNFNWDENSRWWNNLSDDLHSYYLQEGDIVIGMDGSRVGKNYAQVCKEDLPLLLVQRVACIRAKPGISQDFLWACIASKNFEAYIDLIKTGTTIPHISGKQIGEYPIPLVSEDEQQFIGRVSAALIRKIRLNTQINANLASIIDSIFTETIKSSQGETTRFGSMIKIGSGGTPKTAISEYWNGDIPFFSPKDVDGIYVYSTEKYITKMGLDNCNSGYYPKNTTFITARGTVGKIALAASNMAMNQSCYAISANTLGQEHYIHQLSLYAVGAIKQKSNGAIFDAINARDITEELVPNVPLPRIEAFEKQATPLYEQIWKNGLEIESLVHLRDYLLPKLMSGEIDVSDLPLPN